MRLYENKETIKTDTHLNIIILNVTDHIYLAYSRAIHFDFIRFAEFIALKRILAQAE